MAKKLYTAIVFMLDNTQARKYRNISNLERFATWCESIPVNYINVYDKQTKEYIKRIYIKKGT
jgi:hypothetical protein